jgi:hypothetical protein
MTFEFLWELWLCEAEHYCGGLDSDDHDHIREYFDDGWSALDFANEIERMWYERLNPSY